MKIDIISLFPDAVQPYFQQSMMKRAQEVGAVELVVHDLRDYSTDPHKSVDDRPFGGGPGMVIKVDVIDQALKQICSTTDTQKIKKVLLSAKGKTYTQQVAEEWRNLDQLVLIAGHYEGVDERVAQHLVDQEIRVGDYVLSGGELPAMIVADSVIRLLPNVLGNQESVQQESHATPGYLEHPHYTRPADYNGWHVPEVLLSGHHAEIEKWRQQQSQDSN